MIESTVAPIQNEQPTIELQYGKVQDSSDDHCLSALQQKSPLLASSNSSPVWQHDLQLKVKLHTGLGLLGPIGPDGLTGSFVAEVLSLLWYALSTFGLF